MRIPIAILLATSLAVSAAPGAAQETNVANAAETNASVPGVEANFIGVVPPVDGNAAATAVPPAGTIAAAEEASPAPRARRDRGFPWGLLGLLGLVGLLGRRRADRS